MFEAMEHGAKFWSSWLELGKGGMYHACMWYGKIGNPGKVVTRAFNGMLAAKAWLRAKRAEKRAEGFEVVSVQEQDPIYDPTISFMEAWGPIRDPIGTVAEPPRRDETDCEPDILSVLWD
jgi:predicted DNA-binding WGR domain protein